MRAVEVGVDTLMLGALVVLAVAAQVVLHLQQYCQLKDLLILVVVVVVAMEQQLLLLVRAVGLALLFLNIQTLTPFQILVVD
jgi:hypothetical protein